MISAKMSTQLCLLVFFLANFVKSEDDFVVVSTSVRPSNHPNLTDLISRLESRIEFTEALKETNRRLQVLEVQNVQTSTQLHDTLTSLNQRLKSLEEAIEKLAGTKIDKNTIPKHCQEIKERGTRVSGMYLIQPKYAQEPFMVLCDMETQNGGWTYFMNRFDGSVDFYLNWTDYKKGFGSLTGEFWSGLEQLHFLTGFEANELLVELSDWEGIRAFAFYNAFAIGSEKDGYDLKVLGSYSGTAGDSLRYQSGMKFSTPDKDQDLRPYASCATNEKGSWWYNQCTTSNLLAKYLKANVTAGHRWQVMYWEDFRGSSYSLKQARMMVRPRSTYSTAVVPTL